MLRTIIILCFMFLTAFPFLVLGDSEVQVDGTLRIKPGGQIIFPDNTVQNTRTTCTSSTCSDGIMSNAVLVECGGSKGCYCSSGYIVKAVIGVDCADGSYLRGSWALGGNPPTGWKVICKSVGTSAETSPVEFNIACTTS
jgi:hypothetical protein